jgi:hypothetical protein
MNGNLPETEILVGQRLDCSWRDGSIRAQLMIF